MNWGQSSVMFLVLFGILGLLTSDPLCKWLLRWSCQSFLPCSNNLWAYPLYLILLIGCFCRFCVLMHPSFYTIYNLPWVVLARFYGCHNNSCYCPEYLIMAPTIVSIAESLGTSTEEILERVSSCTQKARRCFMYTSCLDLAMYHVQLGWKILW